MHDAEHVAHHVTDGARAIRERTPTVTVTWSIPADSDEDSVSEAGPFRTRVGCWRLDHHAGYETEVVATRMNRSRDPPLAMASGAFVVCSVAETIRCPKTCFRLQVGHREVGSSACLDR
jgi:hypothetical protein